MVVFSLQMRIQSGMIAGRLLFGLGGEIMTVLACEIVTRWFRYVNLAKDRQTGGERESSKTNWERKNISTVLAFMFSVSKLGVATVLPATQRLCEVYGVVPASWIATWGSLTAGVLAVCYLACIGREKSLDMETLLEDINDDPVRNDPNGTTNTSYLSIVTSYPYVFWLLGVICILGCGSIDTFSNSAQRFLASVFYAGSQRDAASATRYFRTSLPPFFDTVRSLSSTCSRIYHSQLPVHNLQYLSSSPRVHPGLFAAEPCRYDASRG